MSLQSVWENVANAGGTVGEYLSVRFVEIYHYFCWNCFRHSVDWETVANLAGGGRGREARTAVRAFTVLYDPDFDGFGPYDERGPCPWCASRTRVLCVVSAGARGEEIPITRERADIVGLLRLVWPDRGRLQREPADLRQMVLAFGRIVRRLIRRGMYGDELMEDLAEYLRTFFYTWIEDHRPEFRAFMRSRLAAQVRGHRREGFVPGAGGSS